MSPRPVLPSPLSVTVAVLVTSIDGDSVVVEVVIIVGSFTVFPSVSSPSSETSLTVMPLGLVAEASTVLDTPPAFAA